MKLARLGLVIILLVLLGSVGPTVQASDNNTVDLTVEVVPPPPPPPVGVEAPPTYYSAMTLFGIEGRFLISGESKILRTIEATSEDGMLTITIPRGTIALGKDGKRLKSLQAAFDESPPDPPEDAHIIGLAYDFGPDGATFDPPVTFTWSYDPDALPEGVAEENLVLAYYDEAASKWLELDCVVDTKNKIITASVPHFTTFAIIGAVTPPPPPVLPPLPPPPTPPALPPAPVPPPTPAPVVPAPPPVPAPVVPEPTPPEVIPPPAEINWPLIGGIIGGLIIVGGLLIYFLVLRRRARQPQP